MKGLNKVMLIGNLGADPEMRFAPGGKAVTSFSLATSRKFKGDNDALQEETTWHRIVTWEKLAEACNQSLHKGSPVFVEGRISNRTWEDDAGVKRYTSEVIASQVIYLAKPDLKNGLAEAAEAAGAVPVEVAPENIAV